MSDDDAPTAEASGDGAAARHDGANERALPIPEWAPLTPPLATFLPSRVILGAAIIAVITVAAVGLALVGSDGDGDGRATLANAPCADELSAVGDSGNLAGPLLECLTPVLVFVETEYGSGSGVIVDGGFVVTNLHVIDPFTTADLTLAGGKKVEGVPVKGADPMTDVALLGPISDPATTATFGDHTVLEKGDELYLAGFPGEVDDEPEPTISKGILSRVRAVKEFGQTYLQTDAAIGGGQSGGALIDAGGSVVGISGLNFAENFALALASGDVQASIAAIRSGRAPDYRGFPEEPKSDSGSFTLEDEEDVEILVHHTTAEPQRITLTLTDDADPVVSVDNLDGTPIFTTREALEQAAELNDVPVDVLIEEVEQLPDFELGKPTSPGVFTFEIPEDTYATISIGTLDEDGAEIDYESSISLVHYEDVDQDTPIAVGDRVEGVVESLEDSDSYVVDLDEGEGIEIYAGSGPGDMGFIVQAPGQALADALFVDDSDAGLSGYDAKGTFTAEASGEHTIFVVTNDFITTGYVLKVSKPTERKSTKDG